MLTELKNLGLPDKEARVYLAMLELGPATMLDIAAKAGVNRPSAYVQIEALKEKGLASTQTRGVKRLFIAESPTQLEHLLAPEKKELEQKQDGLKNILKDLVALFALGEEKPVVRYFEGKEGLKTVQREVLKTKDKEMYEIFSVDDLERVFAEEERREQHERFKAKKMKYKAIYTRGTGTIQNVNLNDELRQVPEGTFPFSVDTIILSELVAFASLRGKLSGAIVEHREIAKTMKALFDLAWLGAEQYDSTLWQKCQKCSYSHFLYLKNTKKQAATAAMTPMTSQKS